MVYVEVVLVERWLFVRLLANGYSTDYNRTIGDVLHPYRRLEDMSTNYRVCFMKEDEYQADNELTKLQEDALIVKSIMGRDAVIYLLSSKRLCDNSRYRQDHLTYSLTGGRYKGNWLYPHTLRCVRIAEHLGVPVYSSPDFIKFLHKRFSNRLKAYAVHSPGAMV